MWIWTSNAVKVFKVHSEFFFPVFPWCWHFIFAIIHYLMGKNTDRLAGHWWWLPWSAARINVSSVAIYWSERQLQQNFEFDTFVIFNQHDTNWNSCFLFRNSIFFNSPSDQNGTKFHFIITFSDFTRILLNHFPPYRLNWFTD